MNWLSLKNDDMRVVRLLTKDLLVGVEAEHANAFANNFGARVRKALKTRKYHKHLFDGPKEAQGKTWGDGPGPWMLTVVIPGGRREYHEQVVLKLLNRAADETHAELTLFKVKLAAYKQEQARRELATAGKAAEVAVQSPLILGPDGTKVVVIGGDSKLVQAVEQTTKK